MQKVLWVSLERGKWKVHFGDETEGSIYLTKEEAVHEAKHVVKKSQEGAITAIWVYIGDGKINKEWTYGEDPFPPPDDFII
ncbi:hypothetical protein BH10BAC2_BH10BAC2_35430 [soil metagenome]